MRDDNPISAYGSQGTQTRPHDVRRDILKDMASPVRAVPILVVDGSREFRASVRFTLEPEGFQVIDAATTAAARELIQRNVAALVIVKAEDLAGVKLLSWAKESFPALPVIVIAYFANPVGIQDGLAVLLDPVTSEELLSAVHKLLQCA